MPAELADDQASVKRRVEKDPYLIALADPGDWTDLVRPDTGPRPPPLRARLGGKARMQDGGAVRFVGRKSLAELRRATINLALPLVWLGSPSA